MPATTYHATDDNALLNGTFYARIQPRVTVQPTIVKYSLGDHQGYARELPTGLRVYTAKEFKRLRRN